MAARTVAATPKESVWKKIGDLSFKEKLHLALTFVGIIALIILVLVPTTRSWAVNVEMSNDLLTGIGVGVALTLGVLILAYDPLAMWIVRLHNVGWVILAGGLYMLVGKAIAPLMQYIAPSNITFFVLGIVAIVAAVIMLRRK